MPPLESASDTTMARITLRGELAISNRVKFGARWQLTRVALCTSCRNRLIPMKKVCAGFFEVHVQQRSQWYKLYFDAPPDRRLNKIVCPSLQRKTVVNEINSVFHIPAYRVKSASVSFGGNGKKVKIIAITDTNHHIDNFITGIHG